MKLNIITIVGARPQFVKAAALSRYIATMCRDVVAEKIIHTGQHYDYNMSNMFFEQMQIPKPDFQFVVRKGTHGAMTGKMLADIEEVLLEQRPDLVVVYGDTNSTLAGALAAAKLHIPVAHVEAGLRSFNMKMPEEINRILTDRISSRLYCPTDTACTNLLKEGIVEGVTNSGDIMFDVAQYYAPVAAKNSTILEQLKLEPKNFMLSTIHRAENTDISERITAIFQALEDISQKIPVILPLHPRTQKVAVELGLLDMAAGVRFVDPLPFWDLLLLQRNARVIITDSGGVQKEAYFHRTPCITVRNETEWVETLQGGWNCLVPAHREAIVSAALNAKIPDSDQKPCFGTGRTAAFIVDDLLKVF